MLLGVYYYNSIFNINFKFFIYLKAYSFYVFQNILKISC